MSHTVTASGWKRIATNAGLEHPAIDEDGWSDMTHPTTGAVLQRDPQGYVSVHAKDGSWSTGENTVTTVVRIWNGTFR